MPQTAQDVRDGCHRALSGHRRRSVREILAALAVSPHAEAAPDSYGEGACLRALECEVAALLGKPEAVFITKGVVAQQAALRSWTDRVGHRTVALHPKSHIAVDERDAYRRLHHLAGVHLGRDHAPFTAADLDTVAEPLGAVVVELPLRRAGFLLPTWNELAAIAAWCRAHAVPLHLDGARLWEAQPYYDRPLAEIAALGDSVYVSFYKGLGGLGGAVLAGQAELIATARLWHARHAGPLMTAWPFVISARDGLTQYLPRMDAYYRRAVSLAAALGTLPGVSVLPAPPQSNAFQLHLPAAADALTAAHLALAAETGAWLFGRFAEVPLPDRAMTEISIGDAAEDIADDEVVGLVKRLLAAAA